MKFKFVAGKAHSLNTEIAVYLVQEGKVSSAQFSELNKELVKEVLAAKSGGTFTASCGQSLCLPSYGKHKASKILFIGLGKDLKDIRSAYVAGSVLTKNLKILKALSASLNLTLSKESAKQFLLAASNHDHSYSLKSKAKKPKEISLTLCGKASDKNLALYKEVSAISSGVKLTCDLVTAPASHLKPRHMAQAAQAIGRRHSKVKVKIFNKKEIEKRKMGGILAVSRGSTEEPRFIIMEYNGAPKSQKPLIFVGKGLTFDAGGLNIKTSSMHEMKFDMGGGGAVIGAVEAIAAAGYKVNVVGIVPSSENLVDALSYAPSDVLTMYDGQTVEITNTDAEGRLILADALTYACRYYKSEFIVDLATLTGACMMFLGEESCGLVSDDDKTAAAIEKASQKCFDRVWRLPLYDEHFEMMKSPIADLQNAKLGGKAGCMTAAAFLRSFVSDDARWAHLDIAGVAWNKNPGAKGKTLGATGFGVQLLAALALDHVR